MSKNFFEKLEKNHRKNLKILQKNSYKKFENSSEKLVENICQTNSSKRGTTFSDMDAGMFPVLAFFKIKICIYFFSNNFFFLNL